MFASGSASVGPSDRSSASARERPAEEEPDQLPVLPEVAKRTADADPRRDPDQSPDLHRAGHAEVHGQRRRRRPGSGRSTRRSQRRSNSSASSRRWRASCFARRASSSTLVRDRRVSFRIARDADRRERVSRALPSTRSRREPVVELASILRVPADDEGAADPGRAASVERRPPGAPVPEHVRREMRRRRRVRARSTPRRVRSSASIPWRRRRRHGRRRAGRQRLGPLERVAERDQLEQRPPEERRDGALLAGIEIWNASATKHLHDHRPSWPTPA